MTTSSFRLMAAHSGLAGNYLSRERSGCGKAPSPRSTHAAAARDTKPGEECSCPEIDENKNRCNRCILSKIMMKEIKRLAMALYFGL